MHQLHLIVVIPIDIDLFVTHFQVIQGKFPAIFSRIRRSYAGQNVFCISRFHKSASRRSDTARFQKCAFYLSKHELNLFIEKKVARAGIEPATRGFSILNTIAETLINQWSTLSKWMIFRLFLHNSGNSGTIQAWQDPQKSRCKTRKRDG